MVENSGSAQAIDINITGGLATSGVSSLTSMPVTIGTLDPGNSRLATLVYRIPEGVACFRSTVFIECMDGAGNLHRFPDQQPA